MFFLAGYDDGYDDDGYDDVEQPATQRTVGMSISDVQLSGALHALKKDLTELRQLREKTNAVLTGTRFGRVSPLEAKALAAFYRDPDDEMAAISALEDLSCSMGYPTCSSAGGPIGIVDNALSGLPILPLVSLASIASAVWLARPTVTKMLGRERKLAGVLLGKWAAWPNYLRWTAVVILGLTGIWVGSKAIAEWRRA